MKAEYCRYEGRGEGKRPVRREEECEREERLFLLLLNVLYRDHLQKCVCLPGVIFFRGFIFEEEDCACVCWTGVFVLFCVCYTWGEDKNKRNILDEIRMLEGQEQKE